MKNFTLLFALLISMVLLSSSCEKEEMVTPDPVDNGITASDLVGQWNFKSLEIDGQTYLKGNACSIDYGLAELNLNFISTTNVKPTNNCDIEWKFEYGYTIKENVLTINTIDIEFTVLNPNTFNVVTIPAGTELKLKLTDRGTNLNLPLNGTYTLIKQ
jgi:hypothetical protein